MKIRRDFEKPFFTCENFKDVTETGLIRGVIKENFAVTTQEPEGREGLELRPLTRRRCRMRLGCGINR